MPHALDNLFIFLTINFWGKKTQGNHMIWYFNSHLDIILLISILEFNSTVLCFRQSTAVIEHQRSEMSGF